MAAPDEPRTEGTAPQRRKSGSDGVQILVVDDDRSTLKEVRDALERASFQVQTLDDSRQALQVMDRQPPDVVILDLTMPGCDGLALTRQIRQSDRLHDVKVVVLCGKIYQADRDNAYAAGADTFLTKPVDLPVLISRIESVMQGTVRLTFWGTRGSLPVPGSHTLGYGGNTACVELVLPKEQLIILDAGSGIRMLGQKLMSVRKSIRAHVLLTHYHWDHIQGLPFFAPAYVVGHEIIVHGPGYPDTGSKEILSGQMARIYFPVDLDAFTARIGFMQIYEGRHELDGISVDAVALNHPGMTLGYRIESPSHSVCYMTDNELYPAHLPARAGTEHLRRKLLRAISGTDLLIHDTMYSNQQYANFVGWGHSCPREVANLAAEGQVKKLVLSHHSPDSDDAAVDRIIEEARARLEELGSDCEVIGAREGEELVLSN